MLSFVRLKSALCLCNSFNRVVLQRTKAYTINSQLLELRQRLTFIADYSFFSKDAVMPPKRGRPPKAKAAQNKSGNDKESKKVVARKAKKDEDESENGNESEDEYEEPAPKRAKSENKAKASKNAAAKNIKEDEDKSENEHDNENESEKPASKKTDTKEKTDKKSDSKALLNKTESNLEEIDYECKKLNADGEKYNIKICIWNVSGIRALVKKNGMDYLKKEDADIIALQETKCEPNKIPFEAKIKGYKNYFLDSKKAGYCGMALFSKKEPLKVSYGIKDKEFDDEGRLITAEYENFYFLNVYVPNAGDKLKTLPKRLKWNELFKKYVQDLDKKKPVIISGDMNVAHQEIDLKNPKTNTKNAGFTQEERDGMTDLLKSGFIDSFRFLYPDKTDAYTFWSYFRNARGKNIGWRLDYFIVSERIKNKICDVVNRDQVFGSDHCPVVFYATL